MFFYVTRLFNHIENGLGQADDVRQTYPEGELLKTGMTYYNQTGRVGLDEMIHPPVRKVNR